MTQDTRTPDGVSVYFRCVYFMGEGGFLSDDLLSPAWRQRSCATDGIEDSDVQYDTTTFELRGLAWMLRCSSVVHMS